jgi:hypothetical protein
MKRFNVEFSDQQVEILGRMASNLETTKAGVVKTALSLLEIAIREGRNGNSIGIVNGGAVIKEIVGIWSNQGPTQ